jgi:hypothetical protein
VHENHGVLRPARRQDAVAVAAADSCERTSFPAKSRREFGRNWKTLSNLTSPANFLNGSIPEDISELGSLSGTLNLSFNHLSGQIPKSLGNSSSLCSPVDRLRLLVTDDAPNWFFSESWVIVR